jgi:transposase-like protein
MQSILPSQRVRQRTAELLANGTEADEEMVTTVVRLGVERLIQEMLEEEVRNHLGHDHYAGQAPDQEHLGYRNGYEPGRIRTGQGVVTVQVPQVRDAPETYRSELTARRRGNSEVLERLTVEMYTRGMSTRDIEDAIEEATGERLLSRTE